MKLRLPPDLKAQVEEAAQTAGRSLNAEIVFRLEQTFTGGVASQEAALAGIMAALEATNGLLGRMVKGQEAEPPSPRETPANRPSPRRKSR